MKNFANVWRNHRVSRRAYYTLVFLTFLGCSSVIIKYGFSWYSVGGCFLTYVLLIQSYIDLKYQTLPDQVSWPVLWIGVFLNLFGVYTGFWSAILGAVLGYYCLWLIYWIYYISTGKEGLGYGDFKLLAMLGAWLGWQKLPLIILISFVSGSIIGIINVILNNKRFYKRIAFGPFLAAAGWIALVWGTNLNAWYLRNYFYIW